MSALLINAVTEYYEKHVTTALVLLVHLMLGQTIPAANNKARAKRALAQKLCGMKIPVITRDIVQAWTTRALAMTDGSDDPGFVEASHEFLSAAPSDPPPPRIPAADAFASAMGAAGTLTATTSTSTTMARTRSPRAWSLYRSRTS